MAGKAAKVNEKLAICGVRSFGSMWTFYLFILYSLSAALPFLSGYQPAMLYWSNAVQLASLPLILVGSIILNQSSEERAKQDHETILQEFALLKELHTEMHLLLKTPEDSVEDEL